jgi:hypothetical protein
MIQFSLVFTFIIASFSIAFGQNELTKTIRLLDNRIEITGLNGEELDSLTTYFGIQIKLDNEIIYEEKKKREFEFGGNNYPSIRQLINGFDILIEINDRPLINKLLHITIENKRVKQEVIPKFIALPKDIDNDGILELFGVGDIEILEKQRVTYTPILVYEQIENQPLQLNEAKTRKINEEVWGAFYGFKPSSKIVLNRAKFFFEKLKELEK